MFGAVSGFVRNDKRLQSAMIALQQFRLSK